MKSKLIKLFILCLLFTCFIILIPNIANANSISKITMDVFIEENGDATVTEVWETTLNQGTEGYKTYKNLGEKAITDFSVVDNTGKTYETVNNWNTKGSFSQKAYKCGINKISGGYELCWGISEYGNKKYRLTYKIKNLVVQYSDNVQGIYFNFLNIDQPVNECYVRIRSNTKLSLDNSRIWSFGYDGNSSFDDGTIYFVSTGKINSSQYVVGLVRFQENIFNVNYKDKYKSFDDVYDSAMIGTEEDIRKEIEELKELINEVLLTPGGIIKIILFIILIFLINPFTILIFISFWVTRRRKKRANTKVYDKEGKIIFSPYGKKLPDEIPLYRDIPCNKDLHRAYWVCYNYNLFNRNKLKKGFIGALFLKWIKNGNVRICETKKGLFSIKDDNYALDLNNVMFSNNQSEKDLLEILLEAAGGNKILEAKEFKKWSIKNSDRLTTWLESISNNETENLVNEGLLNVKQKEEVIGSLFKTKIVINDYHVTKQLYDDAVNIKGLEKFLLDYSLINEKQAIEVHIWEEYLMLAHLMGIADKVQEQFRKLYPRIEQEIEYNNITEEAIKRIVEMGYEGMDEGIRIRRRRQRRSSSSSSSHDYSGSSRNSGGGGRSYSSGGKSAGGSSGGGFR
ncbi:MAG: DUF2207 domain-containing protein [Clostridia bacterium]|nr:DUF2207 domain-containing protein [Clostridia bacterium]